MLAIITSTILFSILMLLGVVLMFLKVSAYWLIPCFLFSLMILSKSYRKPNCRPLEVKDFIWSFVICGVCCMLLVFLNHQVHYHEFWYCYLSVFLSVVMYADSTRFKSLM